MKTNRPLCIHCRRPVNPHKVETCLRWVAIEQDWRTAKGLN